MSETVDITITTLEELYQFLNEKGLLEVVTRNKDKRFKTFYKIAIDKVKQPDTQEKVEKAIQLLNKNNTLLKDSAKLLEKNINLLNAMSNLTKLSLVLNGLNLCATCVGFAIMYAKLDDMSAQIDAKIAKVISMHKNIEAIHTKHEFNKVLSRHSDMLDCRKKQNRYSEEKMRELVSDEYDLLDMLIDVFLMDVSNDNDLIFTILSLAAMLSVSLKYFDEVYYFNNKAAIGDGDPWHLDHDKWIGIFDRLGRPEIVERIQDFGLIDLGMSTVETDLLYMNFCGQIKGLKQEIKDNQALIQAIDDAELFGTIQETIKTDVQDQILNAIQRVGLDEAACEDAIRIAVA